MSRIGRLPIAVPAGVQVELNGTNAKVKGPKGAMERSFSPLIDLALQDGQVLVSRRSDNAAERALHGTTRAVLNNMIFGVSTGFERIIEWDGVGYRAEMSGNNLMLFMGFSHPITVEPPQNISFAVDAKLRQIKVMGFDKEQVGQVAADIRNVRPVEPYLGKGMHYLGEKIRRKAGKSGKGKK
ncbi:MAG: 50S ribosomal protein L6 [Chloroflexota bacterium]